ncbi:MAG: hypothetical protein LLG09_07610 [Negativicutes bacterium]|nr:hypothetical protein [Negativicutes bacterium]
MSKGLVAILYNQVNESAAPDERDVLDQVALIARALGELGYTIALQPVQGDREDLRQILNNLQPLLPLFIFNLVEALAGEAKLSYLASDLYEEMRIKYTGCTAHTLQLTTNKILCKKRLEKLGIPTPAWVSLTEQRDFTAKQKYILKPIYEDASVGVTQKSLVIAENIAELRGELRRLEASTGMPYFAERYIEGREINLPMMSERGDVVVLPPSEIHFLGYEACQKEKILDYNSKWQAGSFEYQNSRATVHFDSGDCVLMEKIKAISLQCWHHFVRKGYTRYDYRVDAAGNPWLLEINANPCLSDNGAGFYLSAQTMGYSYTDLIQSLISELI